MPLSPEARQRLLDEARAQQAAASAPSTSPIPSGLPAAGGPDVPAPDRGGGFGELFGDALGGVASGFRGAVPQGARDVLGEAGQIAFSGEKAIDALGVPFGQENLGTRIGEQIERVPVIGDPLRFVADVATSPATLLTAGFGGQIAAGFRGAGGVGKLVAAGIEPVTTGGFAGRLAGEVAVESTAAAGAEAARSRGLPAPVQLAAGLIGGGVGLRGVGAARGVEHAFAATAAEQLASNDSTQRLTGLLRNATDLRPDQERLARVALGQRTGKAKAIFDLAVKQGASVEEAARRSRGALAGELPKVTFDAPRPQMAPAEVFDLFDRVQTHFVGKPRRFLTRDNTIEALGNLLDGQVPAPHQVKFLEDVFGTELTAAIRGLPGGRSALDVVMDLANVPRTLAASMDMSAPFRQGAVLIGRPREFFGSMAPMFRTFFNEKRALAIEEVHNARPFAELGDDAGLFRQSLGDATPIGERAEEFAGHFARAVPGVRASERGFATFLNQLRVNVFDNFVAKRLKSLDAADRSALSPELRAQFDADLSKMADWINIATGRSSVTSKSAAGRALTFLNPIMFSPRLLVSRAQVFDPRTYMNASAAVRREMARDLVSFVAFGMTGLGILAVASKSGIIDASIEVNPRSSDFGKGRIGNTRFDPWAGFQPMARYTAQLLSGQRKTAGGDVVAANRAETVGRFAQSKLAPAPGAVVDFLRGETFLGDEVIESSFLDDQAGARLTPLFLQDMAEAVEAERSPLAMFSALPAFFGFGVTAYESIPDRRDRRAKEEYNAPSYDSLTPFQKQGLEERFSEEFEGKFTVARIQIEEGARTEQAQLMDVAATQGTSGRKAAEAVRDLGRKRSAMVEQAAEDLISKEGDREPSLRSQFFAALDAATLAFGITDFQVRDALEDDFRSRLTPAQLAQIDDKRQVDDPSVAWYGAAHDTLRSTGYWALQNEAFADQLPFIQTISPDVDTYFKLFAAARANNDPTQAALMSSLLTRVDKVTQAARKRARAEDPAVDRALTLLYGDAPIAALLRE